MSTATLQPQIEERVREIYEAAPLGIALCDSKLRFSFANRTLESIFGYQESELRQLSLADLAHPEEAGFLERFVKDLEQQGGASTKFEKRYVRRDGHVVWCRTSVSSLSSAGRPDRQFVLIVEDVTERRTAEKKIRESERLVAVGTLAAGIAHEINNPVGSILASAQYALMVKDEPDALVQIEEALGNIVNEARRCGQIVKSVLKFAREESTEKWPANLNDLVLQARDHTMEFVTRYGASLDLELDPDVSEALLNPTEIGQLLANLVRNALQSGGFGIRVTVRTDVVGNGIRLTVADDGPGMPPEVREQIFDPFFTTRETSGGTGLGLSMVHGIVTGHGGKISVHSDPGEGTKVEIEFPALHSERERL